MTASTQDAKTGKPGSPPTPRPGDVQVHCDYISADEPLHRAFASSTALAEVKAWARGVFVPNPPSDKTYYLNDDKTRHRFTDEEEGRSLASLGYEHVAHLRLNEEQLSGSERNALRA